MIGEIEHDDSGRIYVPRHGYVSWSREQLDRHAWHLEQAHQPMGPVVVRQDSWPYWALNRDRFCQCGEIYRRCLQRAWAWAWRDLRRREGAFWDHVRPSPL